ncbi:MAG: hypothetical protein ORN54_03735 [Cyclobacteriaceae bacterium]|nr:hypothetical protein [Cyclobacteriaceae bacterium]
MNKGFDPVAIAEFQTKLDSIGMKFLPVDENDNSDEFFHFRFLGNYQGKRIIYDAVLTTLRLEHESELYELAESITAERFPKWNRDTSSTEINTAQEAILQEEIGLHLAEVILGLQEEGAIKVKEYLDIDEDGDFGVSLDVGLQIERITPLVIEQFIDQFTNDKLLLDDTLYSFQLDEED